MVHVNCRITSPPYSKARLYIGDIFFHNNSVTSTSALTTPGYLVSTLPRLAFRECPILDVLRHLGLETILTDLRAGTCFDGRHAASEAVPMKLCGTPDPSKWRPGLKVI
ncbi:hypothetical protein CHS0354_042812 [Potamilus streckersoni]|uniref:Uncharacterized protein n=1 Tax=Potamilus streckersoni TaxID=2493646 RepID=A0AAE0W6Z4_9BIVA|nr:hypothetical protein CHS0354_042812 [Potamilus streckersoni]